jgi:hypothetical protein
MFLSKALEVRILQLYIWSINAKRSIDGCRMATVARHGTYEVRLVEPLLDRQGDTIPFWIELFDHKNAVTIDSCGGHDFEETAAGAATLISQAALLHRDAIAGSQKTIVALAGPKHARARLPDCC